MVLMAEFESFIGFISSEDNAIEIKNKLNTFLESIKRQIESFFLYSNKGNLIKELFTKDESKIVSTIDFSYGMNQYMEYFAGMQKYINETKEKMISCDELIEKVKSIMQNDTNFIKSLFVRGENVHNKEITIPAYQAAYCTNVLIELKNYISNTFSQAEFNGNILDKLLAQSIANASFYIMNGVMREVDEISNQLNSTGVTQTDPVEYKVF